MNSATELLFSPFFGDKPLFKNQLELVTWLLNTPGSRYYPRETPSERDLVRAQSRLKAYISQLLSTTVFRNITDDFKASLILILQQKLAPELVEPCFSRIISALEEKNSIINKREEVLSAIEHETSLKDDIKDANHIVVISARPIDMNLPLNENDRSIRNWFFGDLVRTLLFPGQQTKYYRFNFPLETYGELFWTGLEKLIVKFLLRQSDEDENMKYYYAHISRSLEVRNEYEDYLRQKSLLPTESILLHRRNLSQKIARELIKRTENEKTILVFFNSHPIFSLPVIAVNPNGTNPNVYAILDHEDDQHTVYKFTAENTTLWRIFFWDKLKAAEKGHPISYQRNSSSFHSDEPL